MFKDFSITILGENYDVLFKPEESDKHLSGRMGYCEYYGKKIVINNNAIDSYL